MKEFWNERFSSEEYVYGTSPEVRLKDFIDRSTPGLVLFPGEGEGRNAVYAAKKGWTVKAIDQSEEACKKANLLARNKGVAIDYAVADILTFDYKPGSFDFIALVFFHLPEELRKKIHQHLISLLKPGGRIFIVGFSQEQLQYNSGGPRQIEMLYSEELLKNDFRDLKLIKCKTLLDELDEGPGHSGQASIIEFEAVKM